MRALAKVPSSIAAEARYVLDWTLRERLGFSRPIVEMHDRPEIEISLPDISLTLRSPCIGGWAPAGTSEFSVPPAAAAETDDDPPLAVLFGRAGIATAESVVKLSFDVWGTIFWFLARVEELETEERDAHGRFAAAQSYLKRQNLLLRPVVDEYVEYLWRILQRAAPGLSRPLTEARMTVTCDVDMPYARSLRGTKAMLRAIGADFLVRHSPRSAMATLRNAIAVKRHGDYRNDPNNTFSWIMDRCEERQTKAVFYFICANHKIDERYELTEPFIRKIMTEIHARGHEIGMHGSYVTYQSAADVRSEFANLKSTCETLGILRDAWGNRQHYLRWDMRVTPDALADAGFAYDSSLSFADHVGFRCGTSHEFPLWSWSKRAPLALRERPLIAMEGAALDPRYMGLDHATAGRVLADLKMACHRYGGNFVLLWHNSDLQTTADRETYTGILRA